MSQQSNSESNNTNIGFGCNIDTTSLTFDERQRILSIANKTYPQAKCDPNKSSTVQPFYSGYRQFPIDFTNCANRNKAFVVNGDCTKFKFSINETIPNEQTYMDAYNNCILSATGNCQTHLDNLNKAKIDYAITTALNNCNSSSTNCGVYDVNNILYTYNPNSTSGNISNVLSNNNNMSISSVSSFISVCFCMIIILILLV
jgi:hypothetical protein